MNLRSDEVRLDGRWETVGGRTLADAVCERIGALIDKHLQRVAIIGWDTLYRDPQDGRYWELLYLQSEMHGGGPPSLIQVTTEFARAKYEFNISGEVP